MSEGVKDAGDIVTGVVVVGTVAEWLPPLAAFFAIVWTGIRIYEWARVVIFKKPKRGILE
jgi:hypothetical protein